MGLDPGTLGILSLASGVLGTGVSVLGAMNQASAQAAQANYQAQVAKNNQTIAYQNREAAAQQAQQQAAQVSLANANRIGEIRAAYGAGNIDPNTGSAKDVQVGQREVGELSTANTIYQGQLQQYGYASQATGYAAQAGLETAIAQQAPTAGLISAGGSLLQGASNFASRYSYLQNTGALPADSYYGTYGTGGL